LARALFQALAGLLKRGAGVDGGVLDRASTVLLDLVDLGAPRAAALNEPFW